MNRINVTDNYGFYHNKLLLGYSSNSSDLESLAHMSAECTKCRMDAALAEITEKCNEHVEALTVCVRAHPDNWTTACSKEKEALNECGKSYECN